MKSRIKKVKKEVKKREERLERQRAKFAQMATEELQLCLLLGEFHKAYLAIELGCEEETIEKLKARLASLMPAEGETVRTVVQEETVGDESFDDFTV